MTFARAPSPARLIKLNRSKQPSREDLEYSREYVESSHFKKNLLLVNEERVTGLNRPTLERLKLVKTNYFSKDWRSKEYYLPMSSVIPAFTVYEPCVGCFVAKSAATAVDPKRD